MKYPVSFDLELKKNPYPGKYIALEGIDGSGKSIQIEKLQEYFTKLGKDVIVVKESKTPGPIGDLIRDALFQKISVTPVALQHLYVAQRSDLYEQIIIPALKEGKIVLSDRCFWSSIPYGVSDVISPNEQENEKQLSLVAYGILSFYHQYIIPDKTIYLGVSVSTATQRLINTGRTLDRYEKEEKLTFIIALYQWLLDTFPDAFSIVNGEKNVEEVTEEIIGFIKRSVK